MSRVPLPWLLTLISAVLSLGTAASLASGGGYDDQPNARRVQRARTSPERAAELFVQAWGNGDLTTARALSDGEARASLDTEHGPTKHPGPDPSLIIDESHGPGGNALLLVGQVQSLGLGEARKISLLVEKRASGWYVLEVLWPEP